ncbi:hypothetical protein COLO4_38032 [Corchorus olitorius]|uniref:Uncharacterized protein n=1 Tax=Corchorus olitorius TaxID=93759 RepID=A0A1R3FXG9_9ROSI|nr:hypothetical protein COLO4_38032 [Corchorus olitorius]
MTAFQDEDGGNDVRKDIPEEQEHPMVKSSDPKAP